MRIQLITNLISICNPRTLHVVALNVQSAVNQANAKFDTVYEIIWMVQPDQFLVFHFWYSSTATIDNYESIKGSPMVLRKPCRQC